jgi:hypothetical protein
MTMRERFEVKPYEKIFGLYLDGELIGTSKLHCDCDSTREIILRAVEKKSTLREHYSEDGFNWRQR